MQGRQALKKRQLVWKNLTDKELLQLLEKSSDNETYFSDDDNNFELDDESSNDELDSDGVDDGDNESGAVLSTTQGQHQVHIVTDLAQAANPAVGTTLAESTANGVLPSWREIGELLNILTHKQTELQQAALNRNCLLALNAIFVQLISKHNNTEILLNLCLDWMMNIKIKLYPSSTARNERGATSDKEICQCSLQSWTVWRNTECVKVLLTMDFGQSQGKIKECAGLALKQVR
ncbi:unnamed protein product [Diabrotica balteata]|uniref:Uncharacterized protein n=1 Tax=Diabrotica balteata TaxID=107213 RepID=A0A9N9STZ1_DIABA|nr:unnamed protein product [Diabrotica balteata]